MKSFVTQFNECKTAGYCNGIIKKKITPNMLPFCPCKAKKFAKKIREGKMTHMTFILCGRFGGTCRSRHPHCMEMRALVH